MTLPRLKLAALHLVSESRNQSADSENESFERLLYYDQDLGRIRLLPLHATCLLTLQLRFLFYNHSSQNASTCLWPKNALRQDLG